MGKEYRINLTKRYNVTFVKDGVKYKTGDEVSVGMALASKFYAEGKIEATNELINDARALGCEELFTKGKSAKKATV